MGNETSRKSEERAPIGDVVIDMPPSTPQKAKDLLQREEQWCPHHREDECSCDGGQGDFTHSEESDSQ